VSVHAHAKDAARVVLRGSTHWSVPRQTAVAAQPQRELHQTPAVSASSRMYVHIAPGRADV